MTVSAGAPTLLFHNRPQEIMARMHM